MDTNLSKSKEARRLLKWNPKINIEDYVKNWISDENYGYVDDQKEVT